MPPLRVGVIGVGGIAQMMHLPTLAERPDLFTIAALADVSEKTLQAVGDRYDVATRVRDYRELLGRPDLDALLVFTSGCHRDAMLDLVKSDKHLFVEKPVAYSLKETEEVAAAARGRRGAAHGRLSQAVRPRVPARAGRGAARCASLRYVEVTVLHPDDSGARTHHAVLPVPEKPWSQRPEADIDRGLAEHVATGAGAGCVDLMVGKQAPADPSAGRVHPLRQPHPRRERGARDPRRAGARALRPRLARRHGPDVAHRLPEATCGW